MIKIVGGGVALFVLGIGVIILTQGQDLAALSKAFRAEPATAELAWAVIVLVPLVLLPCAVWLCDTLVRQRQAANALELRLDGVREGVKALVKPQVDAESTAHHLARTDPEDAIGAMQQRLSEAERVAQVQQGRNETGDLASRVEAVRAQQQRLQERLAPVLEKRRAIEQLFAELDSRQHDTERALAEIATGDDAVALDLRLKNMADFVKQSHARCDEIENAAKAIAGLKDDYAALGVRLSPFASEQDGVARGVKDLNEARDKLAAAIDTLRQTPQGSLDVRVRSFADDKKKLDEEVANLGVQFSKLATLRKDIEGLFGSFDRALDALAIARDGAGGADGDARIAEVSQYIDRTQNQFDDIEHRMVVFGQLKAKLGDLQSRLLPLEADDGGVVDLIGQVRDIRDRLVDKVARLEAGEGGNLAERVKTFTEARKELEDRAAIVTDHFSRLATVRKDLAGLFEKLSSAATTPSS